MKYYLEAERLILRDILPTDVEDFFEMDSNAEVHKYLGNMPSTNIMQTNDMIQNIRQQYFDNGIGRWAVIEKESGEFIGWSGMKFITEEWNKHVNFYDVGYRLHPEYWRKGYATESAMAALEYGFNDLQLPVIYGTANIDNKASIHVLEKCGLKFI